MPTESHSLKPNPSAEQIEQQLKKLCAHRLVQGTLCPHVLKWLIKFKALGNYKLKPKPAAEVIFKAFYEFAVSKKLISEMPDEIIAAGKKTFGGLASALDDYYAPGGPGIYDAVKITLLVGIGGRFEPQVDWNSTPALTASDARNEHHNGDDGVISNTRFITEVEAALPEGTDIWIAAPDLSNVGDENSPYSELVREVVSENAMRGVNYTYIFPKDLPGHARIQKLTECFLGNPGRLHFHEVPLEAFFEITLVNSHFKSFNPFADAPDVYMQLPLPRAEKGWIKLGRKDAARIVAKMKSLIAAYHPAKAASSAMTPPTLDGRQSGALALEA